MTSPFYDKKLLVSGLMSQKTICSKADAELISDAGKILKYEQGDFIAREGDLGNEAFYILSGSVQIRIKNHPYKIRNKNELVGEMSILEPGGRRSADLIAAMDDTYIYSVSIAKFHELAAKSSELWRCIAIEIAERLRQRDAMFLPPNDKPTVFIASSSEGANQYLASIKSELSGPERILKPWNGKGIFLPSKSTLEALEKQANESDFAIILVTADDISESRGNLNLSARDNVIFEAGLFMGALEAQRVFLLVEHNADLKLPSDLNGITVMPFSDQSQLQSQLIDIIKITDEKGRLFRYCRPIA